MTDPDALEKLENLLGMRWKMEFHTGQTVTKNADGTMLCDCYEQTGLSFNPDGTVRTRATCTHMRQAIHKANAHLWVLVED